MSTKSYVVSIRRLVALLLMFMTATFVHESSSWAYTCHREIRGSLTFDISPAAPITTEGKIYHTPLIIENRGDAVVSVKISLSSIDSFFLYDESATPAVEIASPNVLVRTISIEPKSTYKDEIAFAVRGAYLDAHYPVRAVFEYSLDGKNETVDLRPVFTTNLVDLLPTTRKMEILTFGDRSFLTLNASSVQSYSAYWKRDNGEYNLLPVSWSGSENDSKASLTFSPITRSGIQRPSWSIHPPYSGGPGVIGVRFAVQLPKAQNLSLRFFSAMRDVFPPEPPTDGVEFRVYASHLLAQGDGSISSEALDQAIRKEPRKEELLFASQYSETEWRENNVDLSKYAGQIILLTLEADPGIKRDTMCDNCFWGDVVLLASDAPFSENDSELDCDVLRKSNLDEFFNFVRSALSDVPSSGVELKNGSRGFDLDYGQYAVVTLGKNGIFDGWITIGSAEKFVQIDGLRVRYQGTTVGLDRPYEPRKVTTTFTEAKMLEFQARRFAANHYEEILGDVPLDARLDEFTDQLSVDKPSSENELCCFISKTLGGLAFRVVASRCSEINSIQFGSFSQNAERLYFGHGYCIVNPTKPFEESGDGFACSTSHVGMDFKNGISLLQATTRPVERFIVNPDQRVYTLTTTCDSRLTLRSSDQGAFDCAIKYAPGFDKRPALLVAKKAGRFVFDYWGGRYADVLSRMKTFVKYGLTNSMLIQHVWQRYGYDVRLPDIWPPSSRQGSLEELIETQEYLDKHGILFGLHDNYIDFYPDADGFSYDDILFEADGQPQKAWYNPGPDAQSYRFNPTKFLPYAQRNLNVVRQYLMQTAYFTDVFSSIHIMDFYDREGKFHPRTETLDAWNRYFDLVHERFNQNAITVSESGNDALIGHLDGADAILRRITSVQESYSDVVPCEDNEFVPWFDAVNHKRFILHGVGYSDRYQGGESRALRGIESDDYISSEVLTGHAVMVDLATSVRGTVRKYWLLQNLADSLALDEIVGFEFIDGNIHRQRIVWKSGVVIYVNRDRDDWTLDFNLPNTDAPVCLPQYGFWSVSDKAYGGVVKINDQIVELRVDSDNSYYVNGRQTVSNEVVPIRPTFENVRIVDSKTIAGTLIWDVYVSTDKPYAPFLHLERPQTWWNDKPELYVLPLTTPSKPSSEWKGHETTLFGESTTVVVPENLPPGFYNLLCGLYDPTSGHRLPLLGSNTKDSRCRLGGVVIKGQGANRELTFISPTPLYGADERLIPNDKPTNFGVCNTIGAFRLEKASKDSVILTPLPNEPPFSVSLTTPIFSTGEYEVVSFDAEGTELARTRVSAENNVLNVALDASKAFSYQVTKR